MLAPQLSGRGLCLVSCMLQLSRVSAVGWCCVLQDLHTRAAPQKLVWFTARKLRSSCSLMQPSAGQEAIFGQKSRTHPAPSDRCTELVSSSAVDERQHARTSASPRHSLYTARVRSIHCNESFWPPASSPALSGVCLDAGGRRPTGLRLRQGGSETCTAAGSTAIRQRQASDSCRPAIHRHQGDRA